ncbi:DUF512 domain-containing protein [Clostridioides difficile]|uniref:DUF512 domain-containing protein n=1 Tax=Clostridioides difficile TaxID=1496 RepID=UPI00211469E5|nr:DUF512 domain-containing protein [Clostridioides difficile]MCQ7011529.1 DUF512 domain-containing protein [Clostridioides difficile]
MEVNVKKVNNIISKVYKDSIAEEIGIEVGDLLISVNEQPIHDIIEYRFLLSDEYLDVEIQKKDGEVYIYEIEKDYDEDLGVEFTNPIIDQAKSCRNKCMFCFIDQLPEGMRETLYFKDDDSRLSFLQGNFVTLTNMSEEDINNIIKYRISPINMNCQIVLCPGINDGKELDRTIKELAQLYPYVNSVAIVPVGITKHRENLVELNIFNDKSASKTIEQIHQIQQKYLEKLGTRFAFLSDEFYILSNSELPGYEEYEGFLQFEDGVGMIRKLKTEIEEYLNILPENILKREKKVSIATGHSAYEFIQSMADAMMDKFKNLQVNVYEIKNKFFGETITVSGLLTAKDLKEQLEDKELGEALYITRSMLKADEEIFLDNIELNQLEELMRIKIIPCLNEGKDFVDKILK